MRRVWLIPFALACSTPAVPEQAEAPPVETSGAEATPSGDAWLTGLAADAMLTSEVQCSSAEARVVRMLVQQRIERGASIAVHLAPIGTPLGETPVYPQWLVGTPDGLTALEEHAAFTEPGFVPIDDSGRLVTEAASSEAWRVDPDWLRADRLSSGEAAAGWTLLERVAAIDTPLHATRCARLERAEGSSRATLLVCADVGVVELERSEGTARESWRLTAIGARPEELE